MKNQKFSTVILIAGACAMLSITSCKKEKDDPEKTNYLEAKINGSLWNPSSIQCVLLEDDTLHFRIVSFSATSAGKTITIEANDNGTGGAMNTGTRSYNTGDAFFRYSISTNVPFNTTSGSINITSVEASAQLVSGTFSFSAIDNDGNQVQVSDGNFEKVSYSVKMQ